MSQTLVGRVRQWADELADEPAIVDCAGAVSYRALDRQTDALAQRLAATRREDGTNFVVVMVPRTRLFPIAALAAIKAGCAVVVINPAYPDDRIRAILDETHPVRVLTTAAIWQERRAAFGADDGLALALDRLDLDAEAAPIDLSAPDNRALVLYTSGTTGKPKGVVHTVRSLTAIARSVSCELPPIAEHPRAALVADFGFIAAAHVLVECLWHGGACHVIDEETRLDLDRLIAYWKRERIEVVFLGSSLGVKILNTYDLPPCEIRLGGEKVAGLTPAGAAKARVLNSYGMSELAPMTGHVMTGREDAVPAGRALPGVTISVRDEQGREVPQGTIGEVWCASEQMALEYFAMPEASAARFVAAPGEAGGRILRTGDRGYVAADGELMLCGRADNMVKLRGQRIEAGEVEVVAQGCAGVTNCACVVKRVGRGDQLCLYYETDAPLEEEALRAHLASKLAAYMVPSVYVRLAALPRNARGKIDRKALPEPTVPVVNEAEVVPPASDNERTLYDIAVDLLGTSAFGVTDDLFALGLTSLAAMELVARAGREGVRLKASDMMRHKTIRALVRHRTAMVWWYAPYEASKDVALFVHGVALTKNVEQKIAMWAERYNVLVVEPIQEHYESVFEGDDVDEVVALYAALVDWHVPAGAHLKVCTGVSWGGKLAYVLACRWAAERGEKPAVVMGDALITRFPSLDEAILAGTLDVWQKEHGFTFNASFIHRMTITTRLERNGVTIPPYDGKVVLLHAVKSVFPGDNAAEWRKHASDLTVVPLDYMHDVIALDRAETMPMWRKAMEDVG